MADNILLLDMGNSRLKTAILEGDTFVPGDELSHDGQLDIEILKRVNLGVVPDHIVASCVAGNKHKDLLRKWAQQELKSDIEFVIAEQQQYGVINTYVDPAQLGSDRWAAIIAAHQQWQGNLCVIDAGTALTLDLVQADGRHLGGYILPGLGMMQQCLFEQTEIPIPTDSVILASNTQVGDSTKKCISNGALQAICGMIERTILQFEQHSRETVLSILTGGDSQRLNDNLTIPCVREPNLVLRGLGHIARSRAASK